MSEFRKKPAGHGTVLLGHYHPGQQINSLTGQVAEARRTTNLQPVEQKPHSQKDRQNEKAEDYEPDEGTR